MLPLCCCQSAIIVVEKALNVLPFLRTLTFSELALTEPYAFIDGHYVEIHEGQQEVYVNTDENCVPVSDGARIEASRNTFGGYALQRM